jgi:hypothetical protein
MGGIRLRVLFRAISVATAVAGVAAATVPAAAKDYFTSNGYEPTRGRVGYHMTSTLFVNDLPPNCDAAMSSISLDGELPPGLTGPAWSQDRTVEVGAIQGTPRQPGDWTFRVILHGVKCGDHGPSMGDRTVTVRFHVDP